MPSTSFDSNGQQISCELFLPSILSNCPTAVIAYGTEAMRDPFGEIIRDFSSELAKSGIIALVPDYFSSTNTLPGFETVFSPINAQTRFDRWVAVLTDAVKHAQTLSGAEAGRTSLIGFSLGGHLVLRTAAGMAVKSVVDFFGPLSTVGSAITASDVAKLPATQIHHGEEDMIVRLNDSVTLDGLLTAHAVPHEFHRYPHNGHPGQQKLQPPGWEPQTQIDATNHALKFLAKTI
jgi:dienelactone hydrolase